MRLYGASRRSLGPPEEVRDYRRREDVGRQRYQFQILIPWKPLAADNVCGGILLFGLINVLEGIEEEVVEGPFG